MKKMLNMAGIPKIAKVVTKVVEIFHWVGTALMAAATVCALVSPAWVKYFVSFEAKECCGAELEVYSFSIRAAVENGKVDMTAFVLFGIGATLILALMAALCLEVYHMFTTEGYFSDPNNVLHHLLTIVVGLEFVRMLIDTTPASILEVLTVAITRSVILNHDDYISIFVCVSCIAGLFAIRRFLVRRSELKEEMVEMD